MKRIIAILLTVLLLGMLTACDQNVGRHADGIIKADKTPAPTKTTSFPCSAFSLKRPIYSSSS